MTAARCSALDTCAAKPRRLLPPNISIFPLSVSRRSRQRERLRGISTSFGKPPPIATWRDVMMKRERASNARLSVCCERRYSHFLVVSSSSTIRETHTFAFSCRLFSIQCDFSPLPLLADKHWLIHTQLAATSYAASYRIWRAARKCLPLRSSQKLSERVSLCVCRCCELPRAAPQQQLLFSCLSRRLRLLLSGIRPAASCGMCRCVLLRGLTRLSSELPDPLHSAVR